MRKTVTWTVDFAYDYDTERLARHAREWMEEYPGEYSYEEALMKVIENDTAGEDDYLYYNITGDVIKEIAEEVKKDYPYNKQLALF